MCVWKSYTLELIPRCTIFPSEELASQHGTQHCLTFELRDLPRRALRQSFVAGVAGQGNSNPTAAKQEADLLASCVLGEGDRRGTETR